MGMKTDNAPTVLMLFLMMTAGCLQAVDDVFEDIEGPGSGDKVLDTDKFTDLH